MLRSLLVSGLAIHASALTPSPTCKTSRRRRLQTRRPLVTEAVDLDACLSSDDALEPLYASTAPEHGYARCPDCTAPVDVVSVDALLSARAFHRECRNYAEADLLLEQLRAVCGVVVDDEKMSWRYSDRAEKPAEAAEALPRFDGDAAELDVALVNAVEAILRRRAAAQLAKDYVVADALRDELRAEYNVAVHDRDGRWRLLEPTKRRLV